MSADRSPLDPADEEELRAAAALEAALEGRASSDDVPEAALETAALLRFSTEQGRLSEARRASLRAQILGELPEPKPAPSEPRRGFFGAGLRWLMLPVGLAGAAFAALLIVRSESETSSGPAPLAVAPSARSEGAADAPEAKGQAIGRAASSAAAKPGAEGSRAPVDEWTRSARQTRAELLPALKRPEIARAHELADRASSPEELERARQVLSALAIAASDFDRASPESAWVRQDLFCRLAELELRQGQPRSALEWTAQGLALDGPDSAFLAQLHALDGQAKGLLGNETGAAASYMKALAINERLLNESLGDSSVPKAKSAKEPKP